MRHNHFCDACLKVFIDKKIIYAIINNKNIFYWYLVTFNIPKTLMVLLICLTFVGQAVASTIMSYSMTGMSTQEQSQDMSQMKHSGHHMTDDLTSDESKKSTKDCCVKTCSCFAGGCSSAAVALNKYVSNDLIINFSSKINFISSLAQSQQLTSLYRPPILS